MATEADPTKANNVGVDDKIGEDIKQETIKHLEKEIEMFKKNLEDTEKSKKNYEDQWKIDEELWKLQLEGDNYKKLVPTFKYEESPRYWELIKTKIEYKFRMDKFMADKKLDEFDRMKTQIEDQIKSSQDKYNEMKG